MRPAFHRLLPCLLALAAVAACAQPGVGPHAAAAASPVAPPRDLPFQGAITLSVDATDTVHRVYGVRERVPVQGAREIVLLYPQWETGSHAATASAAALAGLRVSADGRRLDWRRDAVNAFAFHVDLPSGTAALDVEFQFLSPLSARGGMVTMTGDVVTVPWPSVLVYPAGWYARDIPVDATLRLPPGLHAATSLEALPPDASLDESLLRFERTTLERLADSPVIAGRHVRREALGSFGAAPVRLALFAEDAASLAGGDVAIAGLRRLVEQARALFGARHFDHYDFLVTLGDAFPGPGGIEHLASSESVLPADTLTHPESQLVNADLLAHEFVHSWNGRYRQPDDLWTPNLNEPMRGALLWVYEGQTQFWGRVLAARAGRRRRPPARAERRPPRPRRLRAVVLRRP